MPSLFPEPSQPRVPLSRTSPQAWLVAHCDGGARGNPGPAGFGAQITTESGEVVAELSEFLGIRTNNFAEYSGLLGVLAWAIEHNYKRLRVVSDSELMVKQIQGKYKVNSPDLKPLWTEARARIAKLDQFEITHALRHKNKEADRLANEAMDRGMGRGPEQARGMGRGADQASGTGREPGKQTPATPSATNAPKRELSATPYPKHPSAAPPKFEMLRGFTRNGVVHLLGGATLPDGIFVKIVPE